VDVDRNAPVTIERVAEIEATPDAVWDVLVDVEGWPDWNPDVKSAQLEGSFAAGSEFRWKSGASTIHSTIELVERPRLVGWSGTTLGARATHVWRLEPTSTGTRVLTEESMSGLVPRLFSGWMKRTLERSLDTWLAEMTKTVESRSPRSPA
jgi:uncharacterized protein YndB with AHSA1/START domain